MSKSPITCHVLDASTGRPAPNVKVSLARVQVDGSASSDTIAPQSPGTLATGETNEDGRCVDLLDPTQQLSPGIYKMTFFTEPHFQASGISSFYPYVEITFAYSNPSQHYHIPLLISPFSYTTYRGS